MKNFFSQIKINKVIKYLVISQIKGGNLQSIFRMPLSSVILLLAILKFIFPGSNKKGMLFERSFQVKR